MKIAVTTENEQVFQHFGQCQVFTVYSIEDGKIQSKDLLDASGSGHSALAGLLNASDINVLICGGIGGGAVKMLETKGIKLISGIDGSVDAAVNAFLNGQLVNQGSNCDHHDHDSSHECSCQNHCE